MLKILALAGIPILLIAKQPDFGTAVVVLFFVVVMLFAAGIDWKYIGYAFFNWYYITTANMVFTKTISKKTGYFPF